MKEKIIFQYNKAKNVELPKNNNVTLILKYIAYIVLLGVLEFGIENAVVNLLPESYIGVESLQQIHRYLQIWIFSRIVIFLLPGLIIVIFHGISCMIGKKKRSKTILIEGLLFMILYGIYNSQYPNQFDLQMEQNQYSGMKIIQTVKLMSDIEEDLQSGEIRNVTAGLEVTGQSYVELDLDDEGYSKTKKVYEHALQNTEDKAYIGQISEQDREQFTEYSQSKKEYKISIYVNSGLIAFVDSAS